MEPEFVGDSPGVQGSSDKSRSLGSDASPESSIDDSPQPSYLPDAQAGADRNGLPYFNAVFPPTSPEVVEGASLTPPTLELDPRRKLRRKASATPDPRSPQTPAAQGYFSSPMDGKPKISQDEASDEASEFFCMPCETPDAEALKVRKLPIANDTNWEAYIKASMKELVELHMDTSGINEVLVVLELRCNAHLGRRPFRLGERVHVVNPDTGIWMLFAATFEKYTDRDDVIKVSWEDGTYGNIQAELVFPAMLEQPARLQWIADHLAFTDLKSHLTFVAGRKALDEEIAYEYDEDHRKEIEELEQEIEQSKGWSCVDRVDSKLIECKTSDTQVGPGSFEGIRFSVGSLLKVVNQVREKHEKISVGPEEASDRHGEHEHCVGFALTRPPHHHSCNGRMVGFCLVNGVAIAAKMLVQKYGYRVIIVDWDVHFGEGTNEAVREQKNILYISLHRRLRDFFPAKLVTGDRGHETDIGVGQGSGNTINCAFEVMSGDTDYLLAFHNVVLPAMSEFSGEDPKQKTFVLVSAGFDAADSEFFDIYVTKHGFGTMSSLLRRWCLEHGAPMCLALEGGYTTALTHCVESTLRAVRGEKPRGVRSGFAKPPLPSTDMMLQRVHLAHMGRWKWANGRIPPYGSTAPILEF